MKLLILSSICSCQCIDVFQSQESLAFARSLIDEHLSPVLAQLETFGSDSQSSLARTELQRGLLLIRCCIRGAAPLVAGIATEGADMERDVDDGT